jgi:hypothetical protein
MLLHWFSMPDLPGSKISQYEVHQDIAYAMANIERAPDDDCSESNYYAKNPVGGQHLPEIGSIIRPVVQNAFSRVASHLAYVLPRHA